MEFYPNHLRKSKYKHLTKILGKWMNVKALFQEAHSGDYKQDHLSRKTKSLESARNLAVPWGEGLVKHCFYFLSLLGSRNFTSNWNHSRKWGRGEGLGPETKLWRPAPNFRKVTSFSWRFLREKEKPPPNQL